MVALNIRSRSVTTQMLGVMTSASNYGTDRLMSQVFEKQVHDLFNYGINACGDQALVKNCIFELFLLIDGQPDMVQEGGSVDTNIFKMFRRLLIQQIAASGEGSISIILENFFPGETQMAQGFTSLQREALFLKFHHRLSYREVANVMDLPMEQLHSQISKAVDLLLHPNEARREPIVD